MNDRLEATQLILTKLESEEEKLKSLNPVSLNVDNLLKDFQSLATSLSGQISAVRSSVDLNAKRIESSSRELASNITRMERIEKKQKRRNIILYNLSPTARRRYLRDDLIMCFTHVVPHLSLTEHDILTHFVYDHKKASDLL